MSSPSSVGTKPLRPAKVKDLRKRRGVLAGSAHVIGTKEHARQRSMPRRACSKCRMCTHWERGDVGRATHTLVLLLWLPSQADGVCSQSVKPLLRWGMLL